jgi:SAM-dependent methyltransferase
MLATEMGPNVVWLTEALSQHLDLHSDMRVLDMGCGKAASSIFLAKEFGVSVWATDLWIAAEENWQRVCEAGLDQRICPIHAEAHQLPFARGFFDALISVDAYHYFGTDDLYIGYFSQFVKPGGLIAIIVPGLAHEITGEIPEHLRLYWEWDFCCFHSASWWSHHWQKSDQVEVVQADFLSEGWKYWLQWHQILIEQGLREDSREAEMLQEDAGRNLGFVQLVARRKDV